MNEMHALRERAKELRCLYRINEIVSQRGQPPATTFLRVLEAIPDGWQCPELTGARIEYVGRSFVGPGFSASGSLLSQPLRLGGVDVGRIDVSLAHGEAHHNACDTAGSFLDEERELLHNISARLGEYLEWKHTQLLGDRIADDESAHWRWRARYAEALAARLDAARFGVVGVYLGGSTEDGTAGPGSDIDLYIHLEGDETQRRELTLWIEGWSLCLAELSVQQTGHPHPAGLINIHWLDAPPDTVHRPDLRPLLLTERDAT